MTTSYKIEAIKQLRKEKKAMREQEAIALKNAREEAERKAQEGRDRLAKKMARIEAGLPVEDTGEEQVEKPVVKKTVATKPTIKRKGRPKKSK